MEELVTDIITRLGPLVLIAVVFFRDYDEEKKHQRSRDVAIENNNKALLSLSEAVQALRVVLEKMSTEQQQMCRDISDVRDEIDDVKKIVEKNYTAIVVNGMQGEAIIRESFNKRTADEINSKIEHDRQLVEHDIQKNGIDGEGHHGN